MLFVAISVDPDRVISDDADQVHRVRARAALVAFTNALAVSLFALTPNGLGDSSVSVGIIGILFVLASVLSVRREGRANRTRTGRVRELTFLVVQVVVFGLEVLEGLRLDGHPHDAAAAESIARLVIVSFLIGIGRSWELIRGPGYGIRGEVAALVRRENAAEQAEAERTEPEHSEPG